MQGPLDPIPPLSPRTRWEPPLPPLESDPAQGERQGRRPDGQRAGTRRPRKPASEQEPSAAGPREDEDHELHDDEDPFENGGSHIDVHA